MADPASYRPRPGSIPTSPGVYRFRDPTGRVIYVGKAKNLRSRLSSYFQDPAGLHPRTYTMVTTASEVTWTVVRSEIEALQLEYSWIKEYSPRFNVQYRDDKSYPWLAVTLNEEFPRVMVTRGAKRKGVRYFGPYSHAWAIRDTVDSLLRVFPMRSCTPGVFRRAQQTGRPCLLGFIDRCAAPCVGRVSAAEHREIVDAFCDFMAGNSAPLMADLERRMAAASQQQDYETAARLRDDLQALRTALEKQVVVLDEDTDADVIALAADELEVAVQIFHVRGGRIRGQRGWIADRVADLDLGGLAGEFLLQLYGDAEPGAVPREVLVTALPDDADALADVLSGIRGSRVSLRVPKRGDKRTLADTVTRNAEQALVQHKTARASDLTSRSRALEELQQALDLAEAPLRIECYDISHLAGSQTVASMVVFEDGLARKSEYRRFVIRDSAGSDDLASMREVLTRRFKRLGEQPQPPAEDAPDPQDRSFAYPPGLVVVDGGAPQVAAARAVLDDLGLADLPVCGLAKRLEEVWLPDRAEPVILPRHSDGLYLLQRIRDEAHRFAISHHRERRSRSMVDSVLDQVPGLGEVKRKRLLRHFGSLKRIRAASVEELSEVPGIGPKLAQQIATTVAP